MSAAAAVAVGLPLCKRVRGQHGAKRAQALAACAVMVLIAASLGLYRLWGTPGAIGLSTQESALITHMVQSVATSMDQHSAVSGSTTQVGSVEDATEKLARRLNTQGGSAADWSLLAQSYEFMGRSADAAEARKHAGLPAAASLPAAAAAAATVERPVSPQAAALLTQAEKARFAHDYKNALDLYAKAAKLDALNADAWANYADAAASLTGGRLDGAPSQYLARALRIDPDHPKALWLQASLLHEQKRYSQAVAVWRHLAAVLPADSSDVKIIAANIAEALRLSGESVAVPVASAAGAAQINGTVDINPKFLAKAGAGQTLFVFAKSVDSPGPPLAVVRTTVGRWPVKFSLNDSQAMMPQRKLSDFRAVTVEARISPNGQPLAQPGDLHGVTGTLDPKSDKPVHVVIGEVIG